MVTSDKIKNAVLGLVIADAVGVPFEFTSRETLKIRPAMGMTGNGSHNQPPGTWSDDSSLTLCLLDALTKEYALENIASKFVSWKYENLWTARGNVFDIGITTSHSIARLKNILSKGQVNELSLLKYTGTEDDNGNGSLMRILPLAFYLYKRPIAEQWNITWEVSALTHPPFRAAMACFIYIKFIEKILENKSINEAYHLTCNDVLTFWKNEKFSEKELLIFETVISGSIGALEEDAIRSGGYVMHTLQAAIWVLLNSQSYEEAVLKSVNLGNDTDTTAAVVGGIAGLVYGKEGFPKKWYSSISRVKDIEYLCEDFAKKINTES